MLKYLPFLVLFGCATPVITDMDGSRSPLTPIIEAYQPMDVEGLRRGTDMETMHAVNEFVNAAPYVPDVANEWRTPADTLARGGDCEDFAVAKFMILRQLGFTDLMMVAYRTATRNHMVLVVRVDDWPWMLDNDTDAITVFAGRAIWRANEAGYWTF